MNLHSYVIEKANEGTIPLCYKDIDGTKIEEMEILNKKIIS